MFVIVFTHKNLTKNTLPLKFDILSIITKSFNETKATDLSSEPLTNKLK